MIDLECRCGRRLRVPDSALGKAGSCPSCRRTLRLVGPGFRPDSDVFDAMLFVEDGPSRAGELLFIGGPGPVEIGKLPGKPIHLKGERVSRSHGRLVRSDGGWRLEDAGSTNGVHVNRHRVDGCELNDGDELQIGEYTLLYLRSVREAAMDVAVAGTPHARSARQAPAAAAPVSRRPSPADDEDLLDDNLYRLSEGEAIEVAVAAPLVAPAGPPASAAAAAGGPTCPACQKQLAPAAKLCVACGIDLKTGRSILTTCNTDTDQLYTHAESVISVLSWIIWIGIYPIASEAFGTRKPWVIRGLAAVTVLASVWFLAYEVTDSPRMQSLKNLMLWAGEAPPDVDHLTAVYFLTEWGDRAALEAKMDELAAAERSQPARTGRTASIADEDDLFDDDYHRRLLAAHEALPAGQRAIGQYRASQLITHAFLHGDLMHLAGNLVILLVIGSRINALLGNVLTALLYPLLAIFAGLAHMASAVHQAPHGMLGASGAVMALVGMYLVLMPLHKVHMAFWYRLGLIFGFRLNVKLFALRGFWVVFFYIVFDVLYVSLGVEDGVAHWAHLGGFLAGVAIALLLLLTRLVNCRGGDLISALLGRRAWSLVGKPDLSRRTPLDVLP